MAMFNSYVSLPEGRVYTVYAYMEYMHVQSQTIEINLNIYIYIYLFILFTQYIFKHIYIIPFNGISWGYDGLFQYD
jgi:hypothetical protein